MTKLSTDWTGVHGTSALRVSRGDSLTEGTDILGALGAYMVQGLTLEASDDSGSGQRVRDDNGIVAGSRLHNHLQSSGEHNTSRAHSRSTLSANPSPASLSQCSVTPILFSWGKGRCSSRVAREGVGSSSQLGGGVDCGVCQRYRVGGGGVSCVTVRGCGLIFSVVHLPPLTIDSPFTFTVLIIFFADTFRYIVW